MAAQFLRLKGYKILEQRYKTPVGDIDLIVRKRETLVFAEVKAHRDEAQALYAITPRTRRRIEAAAGHYIAHHKDVAGLAMRFDVLVVPPEVFGRGLNILGAVCVRHLDNAWFAGQ